MVDFIFDDFMPCGDDILKMLEIAGRTCYKSEDRITTDSSKKFVNTIMRNEHLSVMEHIHVTVRFTCDRSTSHQLVRHRIAAYSQESQRFVNYGKRGDVYVIKPIQIKEGTPEFNIWSDQMQLAESIYKHMILLGSKPEVARSVLPNSCKTEIVSTFNLRMWRHVAKERVLNTHAQLDIRYLIAKTLLGLQKRVPLIFDDLVGKVKEDETELRGLLQGYCPELYGNFESSVNNS